MPPIVELKLERSEVGVREHNRIARACLHAIAQNHLAFVVVKHFQDNPSTRPGGPYGYVKRSKKWQAIKQRKVGHQIPNVFTGRLMSSVLGGSRITATPTKATLRLKAHRPLKEQQRRELEAMTPGELRSAVTLAHRLYAEEVANSDKRLKRTITI